ncbi:MAG: TolC family protein [Bacteroidota bacterium]
MRTLLLALLLLPATSRAQTVVSLHEALILAEDRSLEVLRADARIATSTAAVDAVSDQRWPSLGLNAGGGQRYGLSFDQTSGALTQSTVESMNLGVSAQYVVFDGFERRAEQRVAEAGLREAELDRVRAQQQARVAVLTGYLAVARAVAAREVAEESAEAEAGLLREIETRIAFGDRPTSDAAQQRERVAAAQGAILAAERDQALAHARLARLLGLDPTETYAFPSPEAEAPEALAPLDALTEQALRDRTDLRATAVAIEAAEANGRAARSGRLPQVSLGAYVGTSYTSAASAGFSGQFGDNRTGSVGVNVSFPLLDRGVTRQRIRQAEAQAQALRAEADDTRYAIALEIREHHIRLGALQAQADLAAIRVEAAQQALAAERALYLGGETTLQSVSVLQARVADARTQQALLRVEAAFERRQLQVALGE